MKFRKWKKGMKRKKLWDDGCSELWRGRRTEGQKKTAIDIGDYVLTMFFLEASLISRED